MSKSISFELPEIKPGYYMAWTVATQCWNTCSVKLDAGSTNYFTASKTDHGTKFKIIEQSSQVYQVVAGLTLTITSDDATCDLLQSHTADAITDAQGKTVGFIYSYCIEDQGPHGDKDYNDIYVNVVAWKSEG